MNSTHGGLQLPSVPGIGASEEEEIHQRWSQADNVQTYLEMQLGMVPTKEPEFVCPELDVTDLTTPDSEAYTRVYAQRTAWFGFLAERKAEHDAIVLEVEAEMEDIATRVRTAMRKNSTRKTRSGEAKQPPLAEMEDAINSNVRYVELKQKLTYHKQVLTRLNARIERLDRELRLTSRQVELRKIDYDTTNRGSNLSHRPGMRYPGR